MPASLRSAVIPVHPSLSAVLILTAMLLWGCAAYRPLPFEEESFRKQAVTQSKSGVRVSAAVLGAQETEEVFGLQLYEKGIQPVWLEIVNSTRYRMWFAPVSVDSDYFSPFEAAYMHHSGYSRVAKQSMDSYFHHNAIRPSIDPGSTRSGFVYTNLELGTKIFNVDILGEDQQVRAFTFLIPVAGLDVDHREVDWDALYKPRDIITIDSSDDFGKAIADLPCCTSDAEGRRSADPINVVVVGDGADILYALSRGGWDETAAESTYDPLARMPWEIRYQPVKPLHLFNRPQDAAFRKSRSSLNERNQLRLWLSPFLFEGRHVWVGQISRIIRRAVWDEFIIEPDVDEARSYLLQDLWYAQALLKYGYLRKTDVAPISNPRRSLRGGPYFTDGLCLVVWVSGRPESFSEVQFMPWEIPAAERRKLLLD